MQGTSETRGKHELGTAGDRPRLQAAIALVVIVGAVCFGAAAIFTEVRATAIDEENWRLQHDATPSMDRLVELQAAVRAEENAAERAAVGSSPGDLKDEILATKKQAALELENYLALPRDEHEIELQEKLIIAMDRFQTMVDAVVDADGPGAAHSPSPQASDLDTAAGEILGLVRSAMVLTIHQSESASERIAIARRNASRDAIAAGALALAFTIVMGGIASRAVRRYKRLTEDHARVLSERASDLERFGERLMHDLRNPLGVTLMSLDTLKKIREPGQPKVDETIARAERSVGKALGIMESFFKFARSAQNLDPGARAHLGKTLESVVEDVATTPEAMGAHIDLEPYADCTVLCEEEVLASIVENLLRNAVKYTKNSASRQITVRALTTDSAVHVEVEDRGPGIPDQLLDKVFEPYVRVGDPKREAGFGLGLAMVKRFCDARGGHVGVRSKGVGQGCTFWFELPAELAA